jgi:hypothetical protein
MQDENEMLHAQITLERHKSETLQQELEDMSKERSDEMTSHLEKQKQYDVELQI